MNTVIFTTLISVLGAGLNGERLARIEAKLDINPPAEAG